MSDKFGKRRMPGELYERWPRTPQGEPVPPKFLIHCKSVDMEDTLLMNMLESYDIPVMLRHPGDGDFGQVMLGMSGTGSDLYVPETMYEQAIELMEAEPDDTIQSGI